MLQMRKSTVVTAVLFAMSAFAPAISHAEVIDDGGFFSAEAVTSANETLRDLKKKTGHDVRIETHAKVEADKVQAVAKMSAAEREKFFSNWLHDRAEATKSRGVFVLICKEPGHLRLWAGRPLQNAGFGVDQAKAIREPLLAGFRAKDYDKALKDSVAQAVITLEGLQPASKSPQRSAVPGPPSHAAHPQQHQAPDRNGVGFGSMFTVLAVIIIGVMVFSMVARMFGGGGGYGSNTGAYGQGYGGYGAPGGGGFMRGLAGGIFGGMAGSWLYDQFSGHRAHGSDTWSNSDYSGGNGGSSFSDSDFGGGTDFGGGDFGGGDGGGGDF